ncbi:MAG: hypothetical protein JWL60_766 [Gemmatimonadetes bacterium]|jgi:hypothetical protein|nr:hypothetical protein [Gemmatimonadota bacterium]
MIRCAYSACSLLLVGCMAGAPSGPHDPGLLPERITVLAVSALVVEESSTDPDVLLTFHVRNDAKKTAGRVEVSVKAFQGKEQVGHAVSHDNPTILAGQEAMIGVRLDRPGRLEDFDCYEYTVMAQIDWQMGTTAPVRKCLR